METCHEPPLAGDVRSASRQTGYASERRLVQKHGGSRPSIIGSTRSGVAALGGRGRNDPKARSGQEKEMHWFLLGARWWMPWWRAMSGQRAGQSCDIWWNQAYCIRPRLARRVYAEQ